MRKRNAWSYIDARDLGKMCHLASQSSGLGFQVGLIGLQAIRLDLLNSIRIGVQCDK